jgi:hypothetical protein
VRGGLRSRLITDSARLTIIAGLDALGWFDGTVYDTPPGPRRHRPLRYITRPLDWHEPITPNALAISAEDIYDEPHGLGGEVEDTIEMWADVLAENDALGWQLAGDIRDLLLGKYPGLGRVAPILDVYDLRHATPVAFTQVAIEELQIDRAESDARGWQAHWFMVRISLLDDYSDEFDAVHTVTDWTPDFVPAWQRIQEIELS